MKPRDFSAIGAGTLTGSIIPDSAEIQHVIASAAAAVAVYLVNALFAYLSRKFKNR